MSTTTPLAGASIDVTGNNFDPNATIKLEFDSTRLLATVKSDAQGSFHTSVKLPAGVTGSHLIVAIGGNTHRPSGCPADPSQRLNIQGAGAGAGGGGSAPNGGGTAFTGVDVALLVAVAAVLLAAGVLFNRSGRRRRHHVPTS